MKKGLKRADELELMLNRGGFTLKGITFTGGDPTSSLSTDDSSVNVAGMKWFPNKDLLALDMGELNFAKKQRGKKTCATPKHHTIQIDKTKLCFKSG